MSGPDHLSSLTRAELEHQVELLQRRLDREHRARRSAETIAERGMRELWLSNQELNERVAARTRELERALETATISHRSAEGLTARVGPELVEPLRRLRQLVAQVTSGGLDDSDQPKHLAQIGAIADELITMLDGLESLANLDSAAVSRCSPVAVIDALIERWRGQSLARGQLLMPEIDASDLSVEANWDVLNRVADALIDNVVRFAEPGPVTVRLAADHTAIWLSVDDSGPGIAEPLRAIVTSPFVSLAAGGRLGIGLAVARGLAEHCGGSLTVLGNDHGGTSVQLALPRPGTARFERRTTPRQATQHQKAEPAQEPLPGQQVSDRWAQWRAGTDLREYETRWNRLEAEGHATHGEADLVCSFTPRRVLDAGCGMGRVAIELDRRGVCAAGADLDDDLLEVARRHAPHLKWLHGDLATDELDGRYDVVVMAGNVMIFCRAEDRAPIVANLAAHLEPGGHLIAGFALEPSSEALTVSEYETACAVAGLEIVQRLATWEGDPFPEPPHDAGQPYAVIIARAPN